MRSRTVYRLTTVLLTLLLLLAVTAWIQPTVKATETTTATKRYAMSFDGENDYVETESSFEQPTSGTMMVWLYPDSSMVPPTTGYPNIIWHNFALINIQKNTGKPYLQLYDSSLTVRVAVSNTPLTANQWQVVTGTWDYDGTTTLMKLYLNNTLVAQYQFDDVIHQGNNPVRLAYGGDLYFDGLEALALYYNQSLSEQEIQHNYLNPMNPITDGLVLWLQPVVDWTRDPPEVLDFSGNGNNGKLYGATLVVDSDSVPPIVIPAGFVLQTYNVSWSEKQVFNWVNITSTGVWADGNKTYTENVIQLTYTKYYEKTATNKYEHEFTVTKKASVESSVIKFSNPITSDYLKVYVDNSEILELDEYDFEKTKENAWHREANEIWIKLTSNSTVDIVWENKTSETIGPVAPVGGGGGGYIPPTTTTTTTSTSTQTQYQPPSQTPASPIPPIHEVFKPIVEFLSRLLPFSGVQVSEAPRLPLNLNAILVALLFSSCIGLAYMLTTSRGSKRGRRKTRRSSRRRR